MAEPQNLRGIGQLLDAINAPRQAEEARKFEALQRVLQAEKEKELLERKIKADKDASLLADSLGVKRNTDASLLADSLGQKNTLLADSLTRVENIRLSDIEEKKYNQRVAEEDKKYERRAKAEQDLKDQMLMLKLAEGEGNKTAEMDAGRYQKILANVQRMKEEQALNRNFQPNRNKLRRNPNASEFWLESSLGGLDEDDIIEDYNYVSGETFQGGGGNTFDGLAGLVNKARLYDADSPQSKRVQSLLDTYIKRMSDLGYKMGKDGEVSGKAHTWMGLPGIGENKENTEQMRNIVRELIGYKQQLANNNPDEMFGISEQDREFYDSYDYGAGVRQKTLDRIEKLLNK